MCQITVTNLNDELMNRELFLLLGTEGSTVHSDGYGFATATGYWVKGSLPMYLTPDVGKFLNKTMLKKNAPLIGHIRQASAKIPVCNDNSHPFEIDGIVFIHNGKLTPFDEDKFVLEYEVEEEDFNTKKIKKVTYKRSDSLVFFEYFMEIYKKYSDETDEEVRFVKSVKEAMQDFYGKFAMVFIINKKHYIVRGKTADLYITFRTASLKTDTEILGWAINTDRKNLVLSTNLLSNLHQLHGESPLYFSDPKIIEAENIYVAEKTQLRHLAAIKENSAPVVTTTYSSTHHGASNTNFTAGNGVRTSTGETEALIKYAEDIFDFLTSYSLTLSDFQNMLLLAWNVSITEVTEEMIKYFVEKIIPLIKNETNKPIRKAIKKSLGYFSLYTYRYEPQSNDGVALEYPWMMNPRNVQMDFARRLAGQK